MIKTFDGVFSKLKKYFINIITRIANNFYISEEGSSNTYFIA